MSVKPKTLTELIESPDIEVPSWISPALLPKGGTFIFGGRTKIGKSFLMLEFARALSAGGKLFEGEYFNVHDPCTVLYLEQELGESMLKPRVIPIFNGLGKEIKDRVLCVAKGVVLDLSSPSSRKLVRDLCHDVKPSVLMLDPIGKMMGDWDENKAQDVERMFQFFDELKLQGAKEDMSIVLSHHFNKPPLDKSTYDALSLSNFSGSAKWTNNPDMIVTVQRTTNHEENGGAKQKGGWAWWKIRVRYFFRAAPDMPDMILSINEKNDFRVRFKGWTEQ